ncbi:MAG: hypothetical protein M3243_07090, partial [Thermoproteota archaeon]|nr:hypothetical protein [Thermoproteota archaeon]
VNASNNVMQKSIYLDGIHLHSVKTKVKGSEIRHHLFWNICINFEIVKMLPFSTKIVKNKLVFQVLASHSVWMSAK